MKPILLTQIEDLEHKVQVLRESETINQATRVMLGNDLVALKKQYIALYGRDEARLAKAKTAQEQMPLLIKAANVLLTLRTALPVNGDADTQHAEDALCAAIATVANKLESVITENDK